MSRATSNAMGVLNGIRRSERGNRTDPNSILHFTIIISNKEKAVCRRLSDDREARNKESTQWAYCPVVDTLNTVVYQYINV
jgi:hypothetical protein